MYASLNDAAHRSASLAKGKTKIWYIKSEYTRELYLSKGENVMNTAFPEGTHILLGEIEETNLEVIFYLLQGEFWSPEGEARELIQKKGLTHTSMMIGDVVELPDGTFHACVFVGFRKI